MKDFKKLISERLSTLNMIKAAAPKDSGFIQELFVQEHVLTHKSDIKFPRATLKKLVSKSNAFASFNEAAGITMVSRESEICPLRKQPIAEKHVAVCGHVFEKSAFKSYIKKERKCPVEGCEQFLFQDAGRRGVRNSLGPNHR